MYSCHSCDVLLPQQRCTPARSSWLTRDNSLLHRSFIDVFQAVSCSSCSVSEITLRQHSNTHLYWDFVLLFTARSVYLIVKLSGLGTSSRLTCSLDCRRRICSLVVVLRSHQYTHSFDLNVLLLSTHLAVPGSTPSSPVAERYVLTPRHVLICIGDSDATENHGLWH